MLRPPARGGAGKRRLTAFFALFLGGTAWGTDYIWTSDPVVIGTDTAWTNSLNWTPSAPPVLPAIFPAGDTLEIASLGPNDPIITGDLAVDSLTVTAGTLDMNGQNLTVTTAAVNGGTITGTGTLTVASSLELNAPLDLTMITATVDISAAAVTVNSPATLTAGTQTADSLTVNGPATVSGNLTVDSFTVASAAATVSGTLTVTTSLGLSSGEIAGTGTVSFGGGTVTTPSATTAAISGGAIDTTGLTLNAGSKPMAITSTGGNILLPLGTITAGDIGLTASGTGSLTSGYTLNQVTNNGSLTLAADLDAGAITNTGTLNLNGSDITGLSGFTNTGGTVNFTGPETITGVTTLAGTVNFNGNSTNLGGISGFGALNLNAGTHALSTAISATAVTINSSATLTLGGSPTAIATLTNNGTLNLNGSDITGLSGFTNNNILNSDGGELIAGITSIGGTVNLAGDFPVSGGTAKIPAYTGSLNVNGTAASPSGLAVGGTLTIAAAAGDLTLGGDTGAITTLINNRTLNLAGYDITGLGGGFTNNNILNSDGGELIAGITSIGGTVNLAGDFPVSGGTAKIPAYTGSLNVNGTAASPSGLTVSGTLTIAAAGTLTLGGNTGTIGSASISGSLDVAGHTLSAAGTITQSGGTITSNGGTLTTSIGSINLGGAVTTGTGITINAANGSITQSGGAITGTSLTATASGGITLNQANSISGFAGTSATGSIALTNNTASPLTIASPGLTGNGVTISNTGNLAVNNAINGGTGNVSLTAAGTGNSITQGGGVITGTSLTATAPGGITLNQANSVSGFAGTSATGSIALTNSAALTIASAGVSGNGVTINNTGNLAVNNAINGGTGNVSLTAAGTGAITQGAAVSGATVTLSAAGDINGNGSASVTAGTTVTMTAAGDITQSGSISGTTITMTATAGDITQSGGTITGTSLTATAPGGITLNQANSISGFAGTSTAGSIALTNSAALTIASAGVSGNNGVTISNTGNLAVNNAINGGTGNVSLTAAGTGNITQGAAVSGASVALNAGNDITVNSAITSNAGGVTLKAGVPNSLIPGQAGNVTGGGSVTVTGAGLRIEARTVALSGPVIAGAGTLEVFSDAYPGAFFGAVVAAGGKLFHFRGSAVSHIEFGPDPTIVTPGTTFIDSDFVSGNYAIPAPAPGGDVYITGNFNFSGNLTAQNNSPSDVSAIEIRGTHTFGGTLTLAPGTDGLRLNGAALTLSAQPFSLSASLTVQGANSLTAAGISLAAINGNNGTADALALTAGGALSIAGGIGTGELLESLEVQSAGTLAPLGTAANRVNRLKINASAGPVHFANTIALDLAGISGAGNNGITIETAGPGGPISQSGIITTGTGAFTLKSGGAITLTLNNSVPKLAITGAGGAVQFKNNAALELAGISGAGSNGITIETAGAGGAVSQSGAIAGGALTILSAGAVILHTAANTVHSLQVTSAGGTAFKNTGSLTITGIGSGGPAGVEVTGTGSNGNIAVTGPISSGGILTLETGPGGTFTAAHTIQTADAPSPPGNDIVLTAEIFAANAPASLAPGANGKLIINAKSPAAKYVFSLGGQIPPGHPDSPFSTVLSAGFIAAMTGRVSIGTSAAPDPTKRIWISGAFTNTALSLVLNTAAAADCAVNTVADTAAFTVTVDALEASTGNYINLKLSGAAHIAGLTALTPNPAALPSYPPPFIAQPGLPFIALGADASVSQSGGLSTGALILQSLASAADGAVFNLTSAANGAGYLISGVGPAAPKTIAYRDANAFALDHPSPLCAMGHGLWGDGAAALESGSGGITLEAGSGAGITARKQVRTTNASILIASPLILDTRDITLGIQNPPPGNPAALRGNIELAGVTGPLAGKAPYTLALDAGIGAGEPKPATPEPREIRLHWGPAPGTPRTVWVERLNLRGTAIINTGAIAIGDGSAAALDPAGPAGAALEADGNFTNYGDTPHGKRQGSITGNPSVNPDLVFYGDAKLGTLDPAYALAAGPSFTHNSDTLVFAKPPASDQTAQALETGGNTIHRVRIDKPKPGTGEIDEADAAAAGAFPAALVYLAGDVSQGSAAALEVPRGALALNGYSWLMGPASGAGTRFEGAGGALILGPDAELWVSAPKTGSAVAPVDCIIRSGFTINAAAGTPIKAEDTIIASHDRAVYAGHVAAGSGTLIKVSGNLRIDSNTNDNNTLRNLTFKLIGRGELEARKKLGNLIIRGPGAHAVLGHGLDLAGDMAIYMESSLDAGAPNYAVSVDGNWIQTARGEFYYRQGTVTFTGALRRSGGRPWVAISGLTGWHIFVCRTPNALIQFSNHVNQEPGERDLDYEYRKSEHHFYGTLRLAGTEALPIHIVKREGYGDPSRNPPPRNRLQPVDWPKFWDIVLRPGSILELSHLYVYYSFARDQVIPSQNTVYAIPYDTYFNMRWINSFVFMYSYTEDADHDGKIDRIRVQASTSLRTNGPPADPFQGFVTEVDGYAVKGYELHATHFDTFYIYVEEKEYPDGDAAPSWRVVENTTMKDRMTNGTLFSTYEDAPMKPVDTVAPQIAYALAAAGHNEFFFRMTEPVRWLDRAGPVLAAGDIVILEGPIHTGGWQAPPLRAAGITAVDEAGSYASEFRVLLSRNLQMEDLADGRLTFRFRDGAKLRDRGLPVFPINIVEGFFPPPAYALRYGGYDSGKNSLYQSFLTGTGQVITDYTQGAPIPPNSFYAPHGDHRLTDILIAVPPANNQDLRYFAWPLWARDTSLQSASIGWSREDLGTIRVFDGTKRLRNTNITLQAVVSNAAVPLVTENQYAPTLHFALDVPATARSLRDRHGFEGLWLPNSLDSRVLGLVPTAKDSRRQALNAHPVSGRLRGKQQESAKDLLLYNFEFMDAMYQNRSVLEFFLHLPLSPPELYVGRLDTPPGTTELPADWFRRVRPFSFSIQDILRQRSGVTVLHNVINPVKGEQVYVQYILKRQGPVTIQVYTLDGTLVKALQRGAKGAGEYMVSWDGRNGRNRPVSRGMYFIRVVAPDIDEIRKVMVVK